MTGFPSTGNAYNSRAFMRILGEDVTLNEDGSVIKAYIRNFTFHAELPSDVVQRRATHIMHVPKALKGNLEEKKFVTDSSGNQYFVVTIAEDEDEWLYVVMNIRETQGAIGRAGPMVGVE